MLAPSTALRAEWRPLTGLDTVIDAWADLTRRAAEPNVFYEPAFALNAASTFGRGVGAILVWSADGELVGLFPLRRTRRPLPVLTGWTHPFAPLGTPLVDRDVLEPTIAAALDYVAAESHLPKLMMFPLMCCDGPVGAALDGALASRNGRSCLFAAHTRPLLSPAGNPGYADTWLSGTRRREYARKRRQLSGDGALASEIESSPDGVARILTDFFALEARGWKGRAGTAATQHSDVERFIAGAVLGLAQQGKIIAARLLRDGTPIAAILVLCSGHGAWGWKVAYDEAFARGSPGVLLLLDVSEHLIANPDIAWTDSCTAPGQPVFGSFWRERRAVADRLIAVTPQAPFGLACRLETWRRGFETMARQTRDRLRAVTAKAK
ncbi:GNAT family N-acetyltransferase [Xanthobacteraceae bacterium Astr-EGSB]|uniref:GNAT family N-acetyltransferase n=1 Tax=Astrobacterium formosum TaxID=3069710 RepID=UPI0027B4EE49|nr:GNAT family N-acetyltransferase [Xanthobacteraceae bacterium Astr-EGSB]